MSGTTPDQIIAHVDLLRAVDQLLAQAETVRAKRETLHRALNNEQVSIERNKAITDAARSG